MLFRRFVSRWFFVSYFFCRLLLLVRLHAYLSPHPLHLQQPIDVIFWTHFAFFIIIVVNKFYLFIYAVISILWWPKKLSASWIWEDSYRLIVHKKERRLKQKQSMIRSMQSTTTHFNGIFLHEYDECKRWAERISWIRRHARKFLIECQSKMLLDKFRNIQMMIIVCWRQRRVMIWNMCIDH